jgi:hypothetical protein
MQAEAEAEETIINEKELVDAILSNRFENLSQF